MPGCPPVPSGKGTWLAGGPECQEVAAIGGGVQDDIIGPALDAPFQHRLQRLVGGIVAVERQVVTEHDEMKIRGAQQRHQRRQAFDILAMDLDQFQTL